MQYSLRIPNPCNESWEHMTPDDKGRHCTQCSKTVVDFTSWEPAAILQYLQTQGTGKTCGRFRESQLMLQDSEPFIYTVTTAHAPYYSKLVAIFLLAFGLIQIGCNTDVPEKKTQLTGVTMLGAPPAVIDTINEPGAHVVGFTEPIINEDKGHSKKDSSNARHNTIIAPAEAAPPEMILQGDVAPEYYERDTLQKKGN